MGLLKWCGYVVHDASAGGPTQAGCPIDAPSTAPATGERLPADADSIEVADSPG
jgi:hypothetical protein